MRALCCLFFVILLAGPVVAAERPAVSNPNHELIVLMAEKPGQVTAEEVVEAGRRGASLPAGLHVGNPTQARYVIAARTTGEVRRRLRQDPDSAGARLERYIVLTYPLPADLDAIRRVLDANSALESVSENGVFELSLSPSDPLFAPVPSPYEHQWGLHSLNLPSAWDRTTGHGYVGIVDSGIDTDHEDLREGTTGSQIGKGNFRPHLSWDFAYNEGNVDEGQFQTPANNCPSGTPQVISRAGHGTHVAGIVGATANNGIGSAGVCWDCGLVIAKASNVVAFSPGGSGTCAYSGVSALSEDKVVAAIRGLVDRGVQTINMSFGRSTNIPDCSSVNPYCDALQYAHERSVLLVAASGNGVSADVNFPARDLRVVAVGGIVPGGAFWGTCDSTLDTADCPSKYGVSQELVAPARQVLSTFYAGTAYAGTGCDDTVGFGGLGYGPCTGTSMASPHIAGLGTLVRSVNPLLLQANVRSLLINRASGKGDFDPQLGYGTPDAAASVDDALGRVAGVVIPNRLTPLFSLYSSTAEDLLYTTVPQMALAALWDATAPYYPQGPPVPGYAAYPFYSCQVGPCAPQSPTASVYVFTTNKTPSGAPPLVPLYRLTFRGLNPNSVPPNPNNRDSTYTTEATGIQAFEAVGYKLDGIEGYIFSKCTPEPGCIPAGAVRLLRRYNVARDDFAIFPESELAAMESLGYTSTAGASGSLGYVYPNSDSDGDQLVDGFERILGTSLSLQDTDLDGIADGTEVLAYPYSDPLQFAKAAQFVAQTVPTTMVAGQSYPVSLTVKNVGALAWNPIGPQCGAYRLGASNPRGNLTWGVARVELPAALASGQQVPLNFSVTAPTSLGNHNFQWEMVHECVEWFGAPSPNVVVNVQNAPPVARFTFTCSGLSCAFNASSSTDNTGIASYAWAFGDGTFGSGAAPSRLYAASGAYTATLTVTDTHGATASISKKVSVNAEAPVAAERYFSVAPCRVLDTRTTTILGNGQFRNVQVSGLCNIPATAKAVSLNVTAISPTSQGYLAFYPGNQTSGPFLHSSLNFDPANAPRANNAIVRLATNGAGTLNLLSAVAGSPGQVHATLDVYGYFSEDTVPAAGAAGPLGFQTVTPCRVADTRATTPIVMGTTRSFTVQGVCNVPFGAAAAALNPVIIGPTAAGHAPLFEAGVPPSVPVINFNAGTNVANGARIRLAPTTPDISLNYYSPTSPATTHAVVDVYGYFKSDAPLRYRPLTACRAVDTRAADQGAPSLAASSTRTFQMRGNCGVPASAKAVAVNLTTTEQAGGGFLTAYPAGTPFPGVSYMNFSAGSGAIANGGIVALSTLPDDLAITTSTATNVIVDVYGYFE